MESIYAKYRDKDGILYISYQEQQSFWSIALSFTWSFKISVSKGLLFLHRLALTGDLALNTLEDVDEGIEDVLRGGLVDALEEVADAVFDLLLLEG